MPDKTAFSRYTYFPPTSCSDYPSVASKLPLGRVKIIPRSRQNYPSIASKLSLGRVKIIPRSRQNYPSVKKILDQGIIQIRKFISFVGDASRVGINSEEGVFQSILGATRPRVGSKSKHFSKHLMILTENLLRRREDASPPVLAEALLVRL